MNIIKNISLAFLTGALGLATLGAAGGHAAEGKVIFPSEFVPEARRAQAADTDMNPKIYEGYFVWPGSFTFQVALIDGQSAPGEEVYTQFCGGSLIAEDWILTAAHCVTFNNGDFAEALYPEDVDVLFGSVFLDQGTRAKVAELIVHEDYNELSTDNDIALLRLEAPINGTDVSPISLPGAEGTTRATPAEGSLVTVSGWGQTETGEFPTQLKAVEVEMQPRSVCNSNILDAQLDTYRGELQLMFARLGVAEDVQERIFEEISNGVVVTGAMICAGAPHGGKDSCQGDSGGPLFQDLGNGRYVQAGIVSWGISCGLPKLYGVYTDLAEFTGWIDTHIR